MKFTLIQLAEQFHLKLQGDPSHQIKGVGTLASGQKFDISFLANSKYQSQLSQTKAGVIILDEKAAKQYSGNALISQNVYVDFAKIASLFEDKSNQNNIIHPTVVIANSAKIHKDVSIGPNCVIGENVIIQEGVRLDSNVVIEDNTFISEKTWIKSNVSIAHKCQIGKRVIIHQGAVIGSDGFGLARDTNGWVKVPQLGSVRIGDDCEIGANTSIDRGTLDDTVLENDVRLDNQIQIAHNVHIGAHTVMAGCSAVAGSAKIGSNCLVGGGVGILGHLEICDGVTLQSMALVSSSINTPGSYSSVTPLQKTKDWRRNAVRFRHLDKMAKQIKELEKKNE